MRKRLGQKTAGLYVERALLAHSATRLLGLLVLVVGGLAVMGLIPYVTGRLGIIASLDNELFITWPLWESRVNIPALVSALILATGGWLWWRAGAVFGVAAVRVAARVVGVTLVFMAFDELLGLHEQFTYTTGIAWQLVYGPVVAVIGLVAAGMLWALWRRGHRTAVGAFVAGGVSWVVAQILELLQFGPGHVPVDGYWGYVWAEESLETFGSGLFLIAALEVLRRRASPAPQADAKPAATVGHDR